MYPVAENYDVAVVRDVIIDQHMPVSEYKIIDVGVGCAILLGKLYERFIFRTVPQWCLFAEIAAVR